MTTQVESTPLARPAPSPLATWWLWIAVSAVTPVLSGLVYVVMHRQFGRHFGGLPTPAILTLLVAQPLVQWAVLRRLAPDLSFWFFAGGWWVSALVVTQMLPEMQFLRGWNELGFDIALRRG